MEDPKSQERNMPVLFLIFNRPEMTEEVFRAIRKAQPKRLFIAADGPRPNRAQETEKCMQARAIATQIDWECEAKTLFRQHNLGCARAVAEAISWFFSHVEEGVILEDDCLPSPHFFTFCSLLLEKYRDDNRVMQIGGNNLVPASKRDSEYSYSFSNHNYIWGWATWRRAWELYHYNMKYYDVVKAKKYSVNFFKSFDERYYFKYVYDQVYANVDRASSWDYQWQYSRMLQGGLSIVPSSNLVINLGTGRDATHTQNTHNLICGMELEDIRFPLIHPEFVMPDLAGDEKIFSQVFTTKWSRIRSRIGQLTPDFLLRSLNRSR